MMTQEEFNDFASIAALIGQNVGANIFNPTPLDRVIANAYPGHKIQLDIFTYSAIFTNAGAAASFVPAGGNAQVNVTIAADSDFILLQQNCHANIANAATTEQTEVMPNVAVLLTDTSSGRNLMDAAQPVASIFGSARQPYVLPQPRLIPAKTNITVAVTSYDAAVAYNLRFSFIGVKVFDLGIPSS